MVVVLSELKNCNKFLFHLERIKGVGGETTSCHTLLDGVGCLSQILHAFPMQLGLEVGLEGGVIDKVTGTV